MTETLQRIPEQQTVPQALPEGANLQIEYGERIAAMSSMPQTARLAREGEQGNTNETFLSEEEFLQYDPQSNLAALSNKWTANEAFQAAGETWWHGLNYELRRHGATIEPDETVSVFAKHTLALEHDGQQRSEGYDIYEIGTEPADPADVETITNTLKLVDELSGGLFTVKGERPRVLLSNGIELLSDRTTSDEARTMGFATPKYMALSLSNIRERATNLNIDPQELLAAITMHEILGHNMEFLVEDDYHTFFPQYFDYSENKVDGENYKDIHEQIIPKDATHKDSKPVTEYGHYTAAEDLATSTEAVTSEVMGIEPHEHVVSAMNKPDAYRKELVMALMDKAAQKAREQSQLVPGSVSNQVGYATNERGEVTGVFPLRRFNMQTISGEEAIDQELDAIAARHAHPPKEFIVHTDLLQV